MTDQRSLRIQSDDARAYVELASARVDDAMARMQERASWLERTLEPDRRWWAAAGQPDARFGCRLSLSADTIVLSLAGELDVAALATIEETWAQVVRFAETRVVVDLSELRFIDSSGMHALLRLRSELAPSVRLELVRGPECVDRVFALTGLQPLFAFVDGVD
jgi:anti-sigma B factor antagonist